MRLPDARASATLLRLSLPLGTLALLWPLLANGGPFLFADTLPYIRGAAKGFEVLFGLGTGVGEGGAGRLAGVAIEPGGGGDGEAAGDGGNGGGGGAPTAARSPWYGALLFLSLRALGPLGPSLLQGLAVSAAVWLTVRATLGRGAAAGPMLLALALATPAALYACYLMPDIFAGVAILGAANLLVLGERMDRATLLAWFALVTAAMLFHLSHVLIVVGMGALGLAAPLAARAVPRLGSAVRTPRRGLGVIAVATGTFAACFVGYAALVERIYGAAPVMPPFVTGRLVVDGPGYEYLVETCPENGYALCAFLDRMPGERIREGRAGGYLTAFLWSGDPERGVFTAASPAMQRRLSAEQIPFAIDVALHDPAGLVSTAFVNVRRQLFRSRVSGLSHGGTVDGALEREGVSGVEGLGDTAIARGAFPIETLRAAYDVVGRLAAVAAALAVAALAWRAASGAPATAPGLAPARTVALLAVAIGAGLLVNAAVTGALSAPADRYQARVVWLHLFVVLFVLARLGADRRRARGPGLPRAA